MTLYHCKEHPEYRGEQKPKTDCAACWWIFLKTNKGQEETDKTISFTVRSK